MIPYPHKILLASLTIALVSCGKETSAPSTPPSVSATVPESSSAFSLPPGNRWAEQIDQASSYPDYGERRAWGHAEIAKRHKTLILKELPAYITRLRGGGAREEWEGTSAAWYFRVPQEKLPDFEDYLVSIGIPKEAIKENRVIIPDQDTDADARIAPEIPATELVYVQSNVATGEDTLMGMKFGKSVESVTYGLYNPNITRAGIRIKVAWKTGDVQILENPMKPDWE